MIARCDVCGGVLAATYRDGRSAASTSATRVGHVRVDADELDQIAEDEMLDLLTRPENVERLVADGDDDDGARRRPRRGRGDPAELDDLADQVGRGELSATLAARAEPAILARLRRRSGASTSCRRRRSCAACSSPVPTSLPTGSRRPMPARREIVRLLACAGGASASCAWSPAGASRRRSGWRGADRAVTPKRACLVTIT